MGDNAQALYCAPLIQRAEIVGTIFAVWHREHWLSDEQRATMRVVSTLAANVLDRSELELGVPWARTGNAALWIGEELRQQGRDGRVGECDRFVVTDVGDLVLLTSGRGGRGQ